MEVAEHPLSLAAWPRRRPRAEPMWLVVGACVVVVAALALVPLCFLLWQSFRTPEWSGGVAGTTLANYRTAYGDGETARLFGNSLRYALGSAALAFVLGTALAWMSERTNTPGRRLFFALSLVPLVVPGILFVVAWILLGSPRIGLLNVVLRAALGTDRTFVDVYTLAGMVMVDGLHQSPIAFLLMGAAFRSMDPALEESALMSGASRLAVAWRITLRLAWPAALATLLVLFVRALESFETPALLGLPAGIPVFTSAIYAALHRYPSEVGLASAYGVTLLAITALGVWACARLSDSGSRYATVTGKGFRPRPLDLGPWRYVAAALFVGYFLLVVGLPLLILVWSSFQKFYAVPSLAAVQAMTLDPYRYVLRYPALGTAVRNSLILAIAIATGVMLLTAVIAWVVVRGRQRQRAALDQLASLPLAFPGLVLGLAVMVFYLHVDIGVYGTLWILLIAYVTRFLPYGMRSSTAAMVRVHRELEESAAMSGASWLATFRHVVLPLLKPGLVAGWVYIAIVSVRELSSSILLYSPGREVVSVVIWELWENGQYVELSAVGVLLIGVLLTVVGGAQWAGARLATARMA